MMHILSERDASCFAFTQLYVFPSGSMFRNLLQPSWNPLISLCRAVKSKDSNKLPWNEKSIWEDDSPHGDALSSRRKASLRASKLHQFSVACKYLLSNNKGRIWGWEKCCMSFGLSFLGCKQPFSLWPCPCCDFAHASPLPDTPSQTCRHVRKQIQFGRDRKIRWFMGWPLSGYYPSRNCTAGKMSGVKKKKKEER